ncbi:ATP-binding protein [uncultured Algoriphagus sp.]|mgnify:CR=1 FL=1|uniref:ATP-binding protein n=1 Tax=uncultured Algoriphagus sp. TaxID=417365 RepID=UPI0030EBBD65|tara:strand:- start:10401 stop:12644 length:2244 start_codon:yes stop_codon:yes gene_type:complete
MQDQGINSIFEKLISESSEMVFFAENTFPYPIFYSNKSFEDQIGEHLIDRSLVGLGLDISSFLFKEELSFSKEGNEYHFHLELPENNSNNYFLFYKGKTVRNQSHIPTKQELLKFFEESTDAQLILKPSGEIFLCTNETLNLFGFSENQKLDNIIQLEQFFSDPHDCQNWIDTAKSVPITHQFSSNLLRNNGHQISLEISSKQVVVNDIQYIMLSFNDISDKITLEKDLEDSSKFLMNLTDQIPGGLYQLVLNNYGELSFSFLSKGMAQVLGLKPEELANFTDISMAISLVHPMDLPQVIMSSIASAKKIEPWTCQFRVKSGQNSEEYRWVLGAARPESLDNGNIAWYGYLTDISQQKEFEITLDESRKAAEKANKIKSDFLSMISHELRTPLNAISGSTYSLMHDHPQAHQKPELDTINFAVDNLIIMINDLLDFQKIEAGKLTIENEPFQLSSFVNQIVKGLSFHARDTKNKLELIQSEGLDVTVSGDKTRLSQVLNNLITNALKFTNEGEVKLKVELVESANGKVKVYFAVCDNGIGIAKQHQEKIFGDFDQVRPTFSKKYGGTGLGLSITKRLLNLMGGEIRLYSKLNEGSKFYFELEFDTVTLPSTEPVPIHRYSNHNSSLHLLLAEDNDVNALVLGKIIKKWGFTYERVFNGLEAVKAVKKTNFDCILMDIQMPEMDGFDATLAIKKICGSPVIALTAAAKLEIKERLIECDFDGFVSKPIDAFELQKTIQKLTYERNQSA